MQVSVLAITSHTSYEILSLYFQGNGHLVNDGYFFYNPYNRSSIIRLDLTHSEGTMYAYGRLEMELPGLRVNTGNYLYTPNHNFNYVDFDVDENGTYGKCLLKIISCGSLIRSSRRIKFFLSFLPISRVFRYYG
jgi:hypothetical protein